MTNHFEPYSTIAFRLALPTCPYLPADNFIGSALLRRVLENALRAEGILNGDVLNMPALNHSIGIFETSDRAKAIEVLKRELKAVGLLPLGCEIGWADNDELIFRIVFPTAGAVALDEFISRERAERAEREVANARKRTEEFLNREFPEP